MDTFTLRLGRGRLTRLLGRSPLVRTTDRVEALLLVLATALVVLAAPVAGAVGTAVYSERSAVYADQVRTRHPVTATVTRDSAPAVQPYVVTIAVSGQWQYHGRPHEGMFLWNRAVKAGERLPIWVDAEGDYAGPPSQPRRAAADAVGTAVVLWLSVAAVAASAVALARLRIDRLRRADWDRELRALTGDDGGRRTSEP